MRLSLRVYRLLLKCYPATFRERYGAPLQRQFVDDYREIDGVGSLLRFWLRTFVDLLRSAPRQLGHELGQDSRYAVRLWRTRPLHTGFTIAALAIAIGANTGVFSVLNALLLRSLPFERSERLAAMRMFLPSGGMSSPREFHAWRKNSVYAADAFSYTSAEVNLDGAGQSGRTRLTETSWNFFAVVGRQPAVGRGFVEGEDARGGPGIAVIGHGLWQQIFAGESSAIGSTIRVNGVPMTVVGVAPPGFDYPMKTAVWTPTVFDFTRVPKTTVAMWSAVIRLRDDIGWDAARQAFEAEAYREHPERRQMDLPNRPALQPLREELAGPIRQASLVLMAGVALLLVLACANVANLLMARTLSRTGELTIRAALGASRARLVQQLLTETVLLSLVSTAIGLAVAVWTTRLASAYQPAQLASQAYSVLDWRVFAFAVTLSVVTGLLFGVGPVMMASSRLALPTIRTATATRRHGWARRALIASQIAVTIVLVTGSIALGRTFLRLMSTDNGYALESVATFGVSFAGTSYDGEKALPYFDQAVTALSAIPGVSAVSATQFLPLALDMYAANRFTIDNGGVQTLATTVPIAPGYFRALGGVLLAGREFTRQDLAGNERVAIVNEEFARAFGEPAGAVGRRLTNARVAPYTIVGVVRGMRDSGPLYPASPQIYWPARAPSALVLVVRVSGAARDRLAVLRDTLASVDPKVPVFNAKTMDERLDQAMARPRFYTLAVVLFGALALLLAVIGVYGIVAYACGERTRELGIRLALGTTPGRLRRQIVLSNVLTVVAGTIVGVASASTAGPWLRELIKGAEAEMASIVAGTVAGTLALAALASWLATRRIAALDVMTILRPDDGA